MGIIADEYFATCRHFTQIDPAKSPSDSTLDLILGSATDAVIVAGTQGVTEDKAYSTIREVSSKTDKPVYFAPSHINQFGKKIEELVINNHADIMLYRPLNSANETAVMWPVKWKAKKLIAPDDLVEVGYIATNPYSTVGKFLKPDISHDTILECAENLKYEFLYLDGSGKLVSPKLITQMRKKIEKAVPAEQNCSLLVGGGLETLADARLAFESGADAIIVGGALEKGNVAGYLDTIDAVQVVADAIAKSVALSHA
jgi:geranylgeranylglyceryl phosphate synthase family protein